MRKILLTTFLLLTFLFPQTQDKKVTIQDLIDIGALQDLIDIVESMTADLEKTFWIKGYYTDSFGDPTDGNLIVSKKISGYFSDSIATKKELKTQIQVHKRGIRKQTVDIDFKLFKYGTRHFKSDIFPKYRIKIKHNGKILKGNFSGFMHSDGKVSLNKAATLKVHQIFLEGGNVSFHLKNYDSNSTFNFSINDIDNKLYKEILDEI